eukprot:scaffold49514_cov33-Phaeocystis_antarctica.AAC.1
MCTSPPADSDDRAAAASTAASSAAGTSVAAGPEGLPREAEDTARCEGWRLLGATGADREDGAGASRHRRTNSGALAVFAVLAVRGRSRRRRGVERLRRRRVVDRLHVDGVAPRL